MVLQDCGGIRRLLALAALSAVLSSSHAASTAGSSSSSDAAVAAAGDLTWTDCGSITNSVVNAVVPTECTKFSAPLCHMGICEDSQNRKVEVNIRRIRAANTSVSTAASSPSVWFLQGGAGTTSSGLSEAMTTLYTKLSGSVNVYTMDQRGSGWSTRFECLNATTSKPITSIKGALVAECAQQLELKFGSDLAAFSITSAATDVSSFISKYHSTSSFVYSVGYGSVLAERLIHLNTSGIHGYVLDAVRTTSGANLSDFLYESNAATDFSESTSHLIDTCAAPVDCNGKFTTTSLRDMLATMLTDFGSGLDSKCTAFVGRPDDSDVTSRQKFFAQLLRMFLADMYEDELARSLISAFVYRMNRCSEDDYEVLSQFMHQRYPSLKPKFDESEYTSSLLYQLITFSEMWEVPTPSSETMRSRFDKSLISPNDNGYLVPSYCAFTKENSTACAAEKNVSTSYAASAIAYKRDQYWNTAATIPAQASVLIISSQPDARTPQKYAERLYTALKGTRKAFFNPNFHAHGSLWWSPIDKTHEKQTTTAMDTLVEYVRDSGDLTNLYIAYGVGGIPTYIVTAPEQVSEQLFRTKDAFEGKFESAESTSSKKSSALIIVIVLSVTAVLLLATAYFYLQRRKNARLVEQEASQDAPKAADATSPSTVASYDLESRV